MGKIDKGITYFNEHGGLTTVIKVRRTGITRSVIDKDGHKDNLYHRRLTWQNRVKVVELIRLFDNLPTTMPDNALHPPVGDPNRETVIVGNRVIAGHNTNLLGVSEPIRIASETLNKISS